MSAASEDETWYLVVLYGPSRKVLLLERLGQRILSCSLFSYIVTALAEENIERQLAEHRQDSGYDGMIEKAKIGYGFHSPTIVIEVAVSFFIADSSFSRYWGERWTESQGSKSELSQLIAVYKNMAEFRTFLLTRINNPYLHPGSAAAFQHLTPHKLPD
jgi:hypothetical protein